MHKVLKSPAKYVQGAGVLETFDQYLQGMGNRLLVLISESGTKRICPILERCFAGKDYQIRYEIFQGECSWPQIKRLAAVSAEQKATAVVGVGGGKILDTAKAVAHQAGLPVVIVPTVASTDSPCSSLSVIYKENGEFDRYLFLNACPDVVLADTAVIAKAPPALLTAGMGDALATHFEARACRASGRNNQVSGTPTRAAGGLADMCWEYLKRDGLRAKLAVEAGACTEAVETIVEVNTYLSSVGFESGGLAAAHAIQKGLTFIPELHDRRHGDKVAFCTLVQLVLEDAAEVDEVMAFCSGVGLPVCLADLGYGAAEEEALRLAAEKSCAPGSTIHNMPFPVTPDMVYNALLAADALGRAFRKRLESGRDL